VRKTLLLLCALSLLLLFTACQSGETNISAAYDLYFPTKNESFGAPALGTERHKLKEGEEAIPELLRLLLQGPEHEHLKSVIPTGVTLREWSLVNGVLTLDFSSQYGLLSGIDLTLADYSVTITLSQVPEVESVVTTVEGDRISYRDRETLKEEDVSFSVSRNEPLQRQVTLFFPRQNRQDLGQESRSLMLTEDDSLVLAVLGALAQGPESHSFEAVLTDTKVLSAEVQDGICLLNLDAAFARAAPTEEAAAAQRLYALVNTLCELESISAVRILSEGEPLEHYGPIELSAALKADTSL